jgi:hypothetical protein
VIGEASSARPPASPECQGLSRQEWLEALGEVLGRLEDIGDEDMDDFALTPMHPIISCLSAWGFTGRDGGQCPLVLVDACIALRPLPDAPPRAVERGCRAIAILLYCDSRPGSPGLHEAVWQAGMPFVLEALSSFPDDAHIQAHGFRTMTCSMSLYEPSRRWLFERGGCELAVEAMRRLHDQCYVQFQALSVLRFFVLGSEAAVRVRRLRELGALGLVLCVLPPSSPQFEEEEDLDEEGLALAMDEAGATALANLIAGCMEQPGEWRQIVAAAAFGLTGLPAEPQQRTMWHAVLGSLCLCGSGDERSAVVKEIHGSGIVAALHEDAERWRGDSRLEKRLWGFLKAIAMQEHPSAIVHLSPALQALRECIEGTRATTSVEAITDVVYLLRKLPGTAKRKLKVRGSYLSTGMA